MKSTIYFDHAATTPMDKESIELMTRALEKNYGNASSIHQLGKKSRLVIEKARQTMAESINAKAEEIIITSGGTESDNMALLKTAEKYGNQGKHIISTAIEHPAVLKPLDYLVDQGFDVTYLKPNDQGQITVEQVKDALRPDTILVSVMYANNEIGVIQPIKEIGQLLENEHPEIVFHTDAVQAYGLIEMDVNDLKIDLLSVSAHKMKGPKGIGFLYMRNGLNLPSLVLGGAQENERRAGTENTPAILAFEKAIEKNQANQVEQYNYLSYLKEYFIKKLVESELAYSINGTVTEALPHILSVTFPQIASDQLLIQLDLNGVAVSAGSACTAGSLEDSHVLQAVFGAEAQEVKHTIRFSFGPTNTTDEIDQVMQLVEKFAS